MKIRPTVPQALSNPLVARFAVSLALYSLLAPPPIARANPFLPKAGEASTTVRVATCAVSGGFVHLYTAMDNGLFEKYGIRVDHKFISGSAMNLTASSRLMMSTVHLPPI